MPIYEYQCKNCDHTLETIQKISEKPLRKCPECGKSALEKLISATAFRLKGDGWYETDFKSGNKRNVAGDKESKSSSSDSGDSGQGKTKQSDAKGGDSNKSSKESGSTNASTSKKNPKKGGESKKTGAKSKP